LQENESQKAQLLAPLVFKERALEKEVSELDRSLEEVKIEFEKKEKVLHKYKIELDGRYQQLSTVVSEVTGLPVQIAD